MWNLKQNTDDHIYKHTDLGNKLAAMNGERDFGQNLVCLEKRKKTLQPSFLPGWKHTFPIHLFKLHSALCMVACFKAINYSLFFWTITSSMAQMVKDLPAGSIPGLGGSPVNGNQLQYSCRETPMDRGAWWSQRVRPD